MIKSVKPHMKKLAVIFVMLLFVCLTACHKEEQSWGSFTAEKTFSFDHRYYAVQTVDKQSMIVTVYDAENNEMIDEFSPARSRDFWGICWEKDSYNIWIQSGDIGVLCYEYLEGRWLLNEDAERPDYIISKYDETND